MPMVVEPQSLQNLSAQELRELTTRLMTQLRHQSALLDKLTHENGKRPVIPSLNTGA